MGSPAPQRRLAAILAADMVGYSRLIEQDEAGTVARLKADREEFIDPTIAGHGGRIVRLAGDGALVEFSSVVEATQCAIDIQRGMSERNAERDEEERIVFRIGVNTGDIIVEDDNLHGEGINVAARLESLCEPGGILLSEGAARYVDGKIDAGLEFVEERSVKNIERPVRIWRIDPFGAAPDAVQPTVVRPRKIRWRVALLLGGALIAAIGVLLWYQPWVSRVEAARLDHMAFPLPDKPSLAVLPFDNLSGDASQEFISDGLTDNIITALSQLPEVFVIARNSTFTYKGTQVMVQQVAEDLGVRYVLQGSYQRAADRVRINAQFIDALSGRHVWAEQIDRDWSDLLTVQDEITHRIVSSLSLALSEEQVGRLAQRYTNNPDAFRLFLRGRESYIRYTRRDNETARELYGKAIALDPGFARAYGGLALTHDQDSQRGWTADPKVSRDEAQRLVSKAVELDPTLSEAYVALSMVREWFDPEGAIEAARTAIELAPNSGDAYALLGNAQNHLGQADEAIRNVDIALRLNPLAVSGYHRVKGRALFFEGRYAEAVDYLRKSLEMNPNHLNGRLYLAASYAKLGRRDDAEWEITQLLVQNPRLSVGRYLRAARGYMRDAAYLKSLEDGIRLAGLPEREPLPPEDKPSIAVLAFRNMSGDPEQEYLGEGIAEDIITNLSKVSGIFVVASDSSFTFKDATVPLHEISEQLGVRYVLQGSVQRGGSRLRITAQLIDVARGNHLWAERYDRELKELLSLQSEVAEKVAKALAVTLTADENERLFQKYTSNIDAYDVYLKARRTANSPRRSHIEHAEKLFRRVIELDPNFAGGYAGLSYVYSVKARFGYGDSPSQDQLRALELAEKAVEVDRTFPWAHIALGGAHLANRDPVAAVDATREALALDPHGYEANLFMGFYLQFAGEPALAVEHVERAKRRSPVDSVRHLAFLGRAYFMNGNYDAAVRAWTTRYRKFPVSSPNGFVYLAAAYALLDTEREAEATVKKLLEAFPKFTLSRWNYINLYKSPEDRARLYNAAKKAGIPEFPKDE